MRVRLLLGLLIGATAAAPGAAQQLSPLIEPAAVRRIDPSVLTQCRGTPAAQAAYAYVAPAARERLISDTSGYIAGLQRASDENLDVEVTRLRRVLAARRTQIRSMTALSDEFDRNYAQLEIEQAQYDLIVELSARRQLGLEINAGSNELTRVIEQRWAQVVRDYNMTLYECALQFEQLNPGTQIITRPPMAGDPLGRRWGEEEGGWSGEWTRRGASNMFDAVWRLGGMEVRGVLTMQLNGNQVVISRQNATDQNNCTYQGIFDNREGTATVRGTYRCTSGGGEWSATIE